MLEELRHSSGALILRSPLLASAGIPHAFATRIGGISSGPFASLNFGNPSPCENRDPPDNIRENFRRLLAAAGCPGREIVEVHQVHGCEVHVVDSGACVSPAGGPEARPTPKADAMVTSDPARALAVRTADCVPVLIASADGAHIAAVHAGWRGVVSGIVPAAVGALRRAGATEFIAAIGPSIGPEAFEVGPEVAAEFRRVFGDHAPIIERGGQKPHIDLKRAIAHQLAADGITKIDTSDHCTVLGRDLFFSHRRDQGLTGRMAAVIARP